LGTFVKAVPTFVFGTVLVKCQLRVKAKLPKSHTNFPTTQGSYV